MGRFLNHKVYGFRYSFPGLGTVERIILLHAIPYESFLLVDPLVSVRPKKVALGLYQVGRQPLTAECIIIGQGTQKSRQRNF
jgi:hypothetical protein